MSKKILLAEDGILNARLLKTILEKEGFIVCHVENGAEAYAKIASQEFVPDLLITDIMMPHLDGFELVLKLKQANLIVPVVFISAKTEAEDVSKGLNEYGARDYIVKPFSPSECVIRVKKALAA
jgi:DNA-binding response OmpR family regulator